MIHKGKHVTRPHERNGPSIAAGFPPNSSEEQMPSYCSRQVNSKETGSGDAIPLDITNCYCSRCVNIAGPQSEYQSANNSKEIGSGDAIPLNNAESSINNVDSSSLLGIKSRHKGRHVTRLSTKNVILGGKPKFMQLKVISKRAVDKRKKARRRSINQLMSGDGVALVSVPNEISRGEGNLVFSMSTSQIQNMNERIFLEKDGLEIDYVRAEEVWAIGRALGVSYDGNEQELLQRITKMEMRDKAEWEQRK
ncbi:hypothetical protein Ancab_025419 [Ancistrocladus abbreviatus]